MKENFKSSCWNKIKTFYEINSKFKKCRIEFFNKKCTNCRKCRMSKNPALKTRYFNSLSKFFKKKKEELPTKIKII